MSDPETGPDETLPASTSAKPSGAGDRFASLPSAVPAVYRPPNRLRRALWWGFAFGLAVAVATVVVLVH